MTKFRRISKASSDPKTHTSKLTAGSSKRRSLLPFLALLLAFTPAVAQPKTPPTTIPALFLSDIHFDPYADPAKTAQLNAAPANDWPAILAAPPSPTQQPDSEDLRTACPTRAPDTNFALLQSTLKAIHTNAAQARFVTLSGDLLAHSFDCKYHHILPKATPTEYIAFTQKTIQFLLAQLRASLPEVPIYTALGNNDSGCTDNHLEATHDPFLAAIAPTLAEAANIPTSQRPTITADLASSGSYTTPLAAIPHTRLIVLDDLFLSSNYATCAGKPDHTSAATQLTWLATQLDSARTHHEHVWIMGHIPPGVNIYASARKLLSPCSGDKPKMFLSSDDFANLLARNSDIIPLALFGHTHFDELRLLAPKPTTAPPTTDHLPLTTAPTGIPIKLVASISPINGNRPTFTLAKIDPTTATLIDYTVIQASNSTGSQTTWTPSYTYSSAYHQPAFDAASLSTLITSFAADPTAKTAASQTYLRNFSSGSPLSTLLQLVWPQYTCALSHTSAAAFTNCACSTHPTPPQTDKPAPN